MARQRRGVCARRARRPLSLESESRLRWLGYPHGEPLTHPSSSAPILLSPMPPLLLTGYDTPLGGFLRVLSHFISSCRRLAPFPNTLCPPPFPLRPCPSPPPLSFPSSIVALSFRLGSMMRLSAFPLPYRSFLCPLPIAVIPPPTRCTTTRRHPSAFPSFPYDAQHPRMLRQAGWHHDLLLRDALPVLRGVEDREGGGHGCVLQRRLRARSPDRLLPLRVVAHGAQHEVEYRGWLRHVQLLRPHDGRLLALLPRAGAQHDRARRAPGRHRPGRRGGHDDHPPARPAGHGRGRGLGLGQVSEAARDVRASDRGARRSVARRSVARRRAERSALRGVAPLATLPLARLLFLPRTLRARVGTPEEERRRGAG
jgi:hypothetical protein